MTWPVIFFHLVAESARMGLRELDGLNGAAETGRRLIADCDKRSRLPAAIDALLRTPVLTPKALAARLGIAPQTGTALLGELQGRGFVKEVYWEGEFPGVRDLNRAGGACRRPVPESAIPCYAS